MNGSQRKTQSTSARRIAGAACSVVLAASVMAGADEPPGAATAGGGVASGVVRWAGPARQARTTPVTQDGSVCGASQPDEALVVDGDGGVRNVVVSLVGVAGASRPAGTEATLEQKGCRFLPHVQALPVGSTLAVGNSDNVLHNVNAVRNGIPVFNIAMPEAGRIVRRKLGGAGLHAMRCDAGHTWMSAYVWTFDHPYYAVTGAGGRFRMPDVPAGSYTLRVWHEGWNRKDSSPTSATVPVIIEQPIRIEAGRSTELQIALR